MPYPARVQTPDGSVGFLNWTQASAYAEEVGARFIRVRVGLRDDGEEDAVILQRVKASVGVSGGMTEPDWVWVVCRDDWRKPR